MATFTAELHKVKETKGTVRYDHPDGEGICPAIYLKKAEMPTPYPDKIHLTITT